MSVYIELEKDPFTEVFEAEKSANALRSTMPKPVRRPMRGMQLKPDSYSYIRVVDNSGKPIPIVDAGGEGTDDQGHATTDYFTNFLIQSVTMPRMEKQQIIETFGSDYVYFYGEAPRVYTIQAQLMNSLDFNWFNEFWYNYENYLRGTKLVERGARAYMYTDDMLWECYLLNLQANKSTTDRDSVTVQFTIFVINEAIVSSIGDPKFPLYSDDADMPLSNIESYDRLLANYQENRKLYWDRARTQNFLTDLYTILTTGELTYSRTFKRNPNVPLRGMIRDNYDEFIGMAGPTSAYYDNSDITRMKLLHAIKDFASLSASMLGWMNNVGGALGSGSPLNAWNGLAGAGFGCISVAGTLV
jgi:hypothetical protein